MVPFPEQFWLQSRNFLLPALFCCFLPVFISPDVPHCADVLPSLPCNSMHGLLGIKAIDCHQPPHFGSSCCFQALQLKPIPLFPTASSPVHPCWTPCSSCPSHGVTGMSREFCGMRLSVPSEGECRECWKLSHLPSFLPCCPEGITWHREKPGSHIQRCSGQAGMVLNCQSVD